MIVDYSRNDLYPVISLSECVMSGIGDFYAMDGII